MPGAPEHPVTLGDLRYEFQNRQGRPTFDLRLATRKATVADLVSALRAEGVLAVERVDDVLLDRVEDVVRAWAPDLNDHAMEQFIKEILDALAEAQPFPPAGGVS